MLKRYRKSFYFQLLILDAVATFLSWILAYYIRLESYEKTMPIGLLPSFNSDFWPLC